MSSTSTTLIATPPISRIGHQVLRRAVFAFVWAFSIYLASAQTTEAQTTEMQKSSRQPTSWEFRVPSGALISTGAQKGILKNAAMTTLQMLYVRHQRFALSATIGWARSRDLATPDHPKLDVFTYDLGAEARMSQWFSGHPVTFRPFVGTGAGVRSYNYRKLAVDARHNLSGYATGGGEFSFRRVHLRLEVRDYIASFKPLIGGGKSEMYNDVVVMAGLRFSRRKS